MRDRGPHSHECATADGGDCHCDCHGTQHGIVHMPGKGRADLHGADVTVTPVKGGNGHVTHYKVTRRDGLPPGGGTREERLAARAEQVTVAATSRKARTLPPPVADRAARLRAALPQTRTEWDDSIGRHKSEADRIRENIARERADLERARAMQQSVVDTVSASMREQGMTAAQVKRETTPKKMGQYLDWKRAGESAEWSEKHIASYEDDLQTASELRELDYPLSAGAEWHKRRKMPSETLNRHLDEVLAVGREAYEAIRVEMTADPEIRRLRDEFDLRQDVSYQLKRLTGAAGDKLDPFEQGQQITAQYERLPDNDMTLPKIERELRRRESEIIREMLASARPFGGVRHNARGLDDAAAKAAVSNDEESPPEAARPDWRARLDVGEDHYPADWLRHSAAVPLDIVATRRAFYANKGKNGGVLAMDRPDQDRAAYDGAFADQTDEVTVHELGHRMEQTVPGLTHLEFAFVRRRTTLPDGSVEPERPLYELTGGGGYRSDETAFRDQFTRPYAGKTYERWSLGHPAGQAWELFQVGTQDVFGRSSVRYGDRELQEFVIGALLTLGGGPVDAG